MDLEDDKIDCRDVWGAACRDVPELRCSGGHIRGLCGERQRQERYLSHCPLNLTQTKEVHVEKGCTDLPLWSDVDLDLGSARGLVVEELGMLDERGVGKS